MEATARSLLESILMDMGEWPGQPAPKSAELHFANVIDGAASSAVLLIEHGGLSGSWELCHIRLRALPYFKRIIWFYAIVPDGPDAPFELFSCRPTKQQIDEFVSSRNICAKPMIASWPSS